MFCLLRSGYPCAAVEASSAGRENEAPYSKSMSMWYFTWSTKTTYRAQALFPVERFRGVLICSGRPKGLKSLLEKNIPSQLLVEIHLEINAGCCVPLCLRHSVFEFQSVLLDVVRYTVNRSYSGELYLQMEPIQVHGYDCHAAVDMYLVEMPIRDR